MEESAIASAIGGHVNDESGSGSASGSVIVVKRIEIEILRVKRGGGLRKGPEKTHQSVLKKKKKPGKTEALSELYVETKTAH